MEDVISKVSSATLLDITENENGEFFSDMKITIGGMISKRRDQLTKRGELMSYITFEDMTGEIEVLVFPSQVKRFEQYLKEENICIVSGNLDIQEDKPTKIRLENISPLNFGKKPFEKLFIKLKSTDESGFSGVKNILKDKNGDIPVIIYYEDTKKTVQAPKSMWVSDKGVVGELKNLLGEENIKTV